ncbi:hypothetical protein Tco_1484102 [Tanacetum coccineum]
MKNKMVYNENNVVGTLMNVPIFVGTFSVMTDFTVLEDMDAYRDEGMGNDPITFKMRRWKNGSHAGTLACISWNEEEAEEKSNLKTSLYQANPKESHFVAVKRIFRYLKGTQNLGLWYPKGSSFDLKAYSDSDYTGCNLDKKGTSGGFQILRGKLVCWSAKKQSSVEMLSDEAEYVDIAGAIAISNNPVLHTMTEHIDIKYYFIRDHIFKGDIMLYCVPTNLQLAGIFTKPLVEPSFTRLVAELGMLNIDKQVDMATKSISFTLSHFDKPLSFDLGKFSSIIGLERSDECVSVPPKETVKDGLATLGLPDEDHPSLSSSDLINSSPVANLSPEPIQSLIPPSAKVNADDTADKSLSRTSVSLKSSSTQATHPQHTKEFVVYADATKSLDASESAEVQGNQPETADATKDDTKRLIMPDVDFKNSRLCWIILFVHESRPLYKNKTLWRKRTLGYSLWTFGQLMDKVDKQNKVAQETPESLYDTESEIKIVKSFNSSRSIHLEGEDNNDANITFVGSEPIDIELANSGSDLYSMPSDDLVFLHGFETPESNDEESTSVTKEHSANNLSATSNGDVALPNAFVDGPAIHGSADFLFQAQVHQTLEDQLDTMIYKSMNKQFQAFNKLESNRFVNLQTELSKVIQSQIGRKVKEKVCIGMRHVTERLDFFQGSLLGNFNNVSDLTNAIKNMNFLLNATKVFKKANAEGEMWEKNNPETPKDSENLEDIIYEKKDSEDEPPTKKLRVLIPTPEIPKPMPLSSIIPKHLQKHLEQNLSVKQFTDQLFNTTSSSFAPSLLREPSPPRDPSKGKGVSTEEPIKELIPYIEEGGSDLNMLKMKS